MKYSILNQWSVDNGEQQPLICYGTFDNKEKAIEAFNFFSEEDRDMAENNGWEIIEDNESEFYAVDTRFPLESFTRIEIVPSEDEIEEIAHNENNSIMTSRIAQLRAMHAIMFLSNDKNLYYDWATYGVPDCPTDDDFEYIAVDNDLYNEVFDVFVNLISNKDIRW